MKIEWNDTLRVIGDLHSTHGNFTEADIRKEDLDTILDAALRAATASGQQSYSIIVLQDRSVMKELTGYAGARALVFCADGTRLADAARYLGHAKPERMSMDSFVTWSVDALLAAQSACIAARSLGIDSLFTNGINRTGIDQAYRMLSLPDENCYPLITLILGYASTAETSKKGRWKEAGVIHYDHYTRLDNAGLDQMIAAYDDPKQAIGMFYGYKEEGFQHYLDWFFVKWLGGFPDSPEDDVKKQLEKSGFITN